MQTVWSLEPERSVRTYTLVRAVINFQTGVGGTQRNNAKRSRAQGGSTPVRREAREARRNLWDTVLCPVVREPPVVTVHPASVCGAITCRCVLIGTPT